MHRQPVNPPQITPALEKFVTCLNKFSNVVLIAHGRRFEFPVLVSAFLKGGNVNQLLSSVCDFVDSLIILNWCFRQIGGIEEYLFIFVYKER